MINKITQLKINLLLVCVFTLFGNFAFAQVEIENQPFTAGSLPSGWAQSSVTFSTSAGGYANFTSTSSTLTSPIYDLTGYTNVTLSFSSSKFGTGTEGPMTVQVSNDGGSSWTAQTFDSGTPTGSYVETVDHPITVTGSTVRIRIVRTNSASQKRFRNYVLKGVFAPTGPTITTDEYDLPSFGNQDELTYSSSKSFLATGANLTANVTVTAPSANFEVSLDDAIWSSSVSIIPSSGSFTNVPVYVRFYPQSSGTKSGDIVLSSTGATDATVGVVGTGVVPQLATPVATAATSITATSFVANWNAVSGASNYAIDVSTSPTFTASGGFTTDLIISEYVEGSSNNKYIEIFNGTGSDVDLSDYELQLYANGSSAISTSNTLSGILTTGSTLVYKNSSANAYTGTATVSSSTNFNGDDAVALYKISTSSFVDIFGVIGTDPGSSWDSGSISTSNQTLVRKGFVFGGVTTNPSTFSTLGTDWTSYSEDNVANLGAHSFDGGLAPSYVPGYENLSVGNVTSYTVSGLTQGTTYYYRVRAVGANTSENSNVISLMTVITSVTWDGNAWSNTTGPDSSLDAVIAGAYTTATNEVLQAKKITVNSGSLTISPTSTVEIQNELINNLTSAAVIVESNGILRQFNNAANTGDVTVKRNSAPMIRLDYTAWSSPVVGQNALAFSPATLPNRFYDYNASTNAYASIVPSTTDFVAGKGILVRAPDNWTSDALNPIAYPGEFKGVPNNGDLTVGVSNNPSNTPTLAGYNLLGNPYPSPISATAFLANTNNGTLGMSKLYFWTHTVAAVGGAYATNNYATHNGAGGVAAAAGGEEPDGIIQVGQGFIVDVNDAGNAEFNNSMRVSASAGQFFKSANQTSTLEKNRMWFGLTSPDFKHNQILVGYISGATNDFDPTFDAQLFGSSNSVIYSIVNNSKYVIQSKALPFVSTDIVSLGLVAQTAGQYTISIDHVDGLFNMQEVYLKDNLLNVTHDIKNSSYTFVSAIGQFDSRFEIVYASPLSTNVSTFTENAVIVYNNESGININAGQTIIDAVKIFDIRGRLLMSKSNINDSSVSFDNVNASKQVLIIQISSTDNQTVVKKIVN